MITLLNRMCWNTKGWLLPTNTSSDGGYPATMGFGHEEWNFQTSDAVDDYVYGFLYYRPNENRIREAEGRFRILFWSLHPKTRKRLLVGSYEDASVTTDEDFSRVDQVFKENKIYERRANELADAVKSMTLEQALQEVRDSVQGTGFNLNFKCPVDSLIHFEHYQPVDEVFPGLKLGTYFAKPTFVDGKGIKIPNSKSDAAPKLSLRGPSAIVEDGYYRETASKLKYIVPQHNRMSNRFSKWLQTRGVKEVTQEANYVDVTFTQKGVTYLAELKISYGVGTTKAIREALGQLLEYNLYPRRTRADKWLIVLDKEPSLDDIEYINILRSSFGFPLSLMWENQSEFKLVAGEPV